MEVIKKSYRWDTMGCGRDECLARSRTFEWDALSMKRTDAASARETGGVPTDAQGHNFSHVRTVLFSHPDNLARHEKEFRKNIPH